MSCKYNMSFAVKDEKELKDIKVKFDRYNMNGSNKEHFLEIVDYFNFHRKDIEDKLKLERSIVPLFFIRLITDEDSSIVEVVNEKFPKTMICGTKEFDLNSSWLYKVKDFIKKYKIVDDLVYLNINKATNSVYITIENIKEKGDVEMSERTKKYVISLGYRSEGERDLYRDKLKQFMLDPNEQQISVFARVLEFAEMFGVDLVSDVEQSKKLDEWLRRYMVKNEAGDICVNLKELIYGITKNMDITAHNCDNVAERVEFMKTILTEAELLATTTYNFVDFDRSQIVDNIMTNFGFKVDLHVAGWSLNKSNSTFHITDPEVTNLDLLIGEVHEHLNYRGVHIPELREMVEDAISRMVLNNPVEAIRYHSGINKKLVINVIVNKEEKECRGILGRLFNIKQKCVYLYGSDVEVIARTEMF